MDMRPRPELGRKSRGPSLSNPNPEPSNKSPGESLSARRSMELKSKPTARQTSASADNARCSDPQKHSPRASRLEEPPGPTLRAADHSHIKTEPDESRSPIPNTSPNRISVDPVEAGLRRQCRQESSRDDPYQNSHQYVKQEPMDSFTKLTLADLKRHEPARPSKRRAPEQDSWPNKIRGEDRGSTSPYSARHHEQAHSHGPSPPVGSIRTKSPSAGIPSAQRTPLSSPQLTSLQPASIPGRHTPRQSLQSANQQPLAFQPLHDDTKAFGHSPSPTTPYNDAPFDQDTKMLRQPETRPISQEQLVNEVKGIYAGLVMVEKKCVEICQQQSQTTNKLSNEQWQALIALHRTLLHEHHDFFLASQHPTASPALRRLSTKYAMPARMWRHGIHSFLELLRHRLPHSLEHMLSFVYLAYQMMGLLMESVPTFHETWIECLGDLARYRMAIEEADMRDRENWSNVARMWYNRAADRSPTTGRIQHHLAVLARPNIVRQLFYYSKALISIIPFLNARDSIMLLFTPLLENSEPSSQKYHKAESSLVTAAGIMFTRGSIRSYRANITQYAEELDSHITRSGSNFKVQGAEIASSLIALILDFGHDDNYLWKAFRSNHDKIKGISQTDKGQEPPMENIPLEDPLIMEDIHRKFWHNGPINTSDFRQAAPPNGDRPNKFKSSDEVTSYILPVFYQSVSTVAGKVGDRNTLTFMHLILVFIRSLSYVPGALIFIERYIPWEKIVLCLNTLSRSGVVDSRVEAEEFPQQQSGTGRQLPEDFLIRGLIWAPYYFPPGFFQGQVVDEDERSLELPSHAAPRAERILWCGVRLASLNRYLTYDARLKLFACTEYASSLTNDSITDTLHVQPSIERDTDAKMVDVDV